MNTRIIAAAAVIAFAVFSFFCLRGHAPAIAADLAAKSTGALASAGMGFVAVTANGRELNLAGTVPVESDKIRAEQLVASVTGVRHVTNDLEVRGVETAAVVPATVTPYEFRITRTPDSVTLRGLVPDDATRLLLLNQATRSYGSAEIQDEIEISDGAPADWAQALTTIQNELSGYVQGDAFLSNENIQVRGLVPGDRASATTRLAASFPSHYKTDIELAATVQDNGSVCQAELNRLLADNHINFAVSSATISNDSFGLLDRVAQTIRGCPSASIRIGGHTDSQGRADTNVALSERRAQAVASYLVAAGIAGKQLQAEGFGESQPISSNDTQEGRALNRRIEFSVLGTER